LIADDDDVLRLALGTMLHKRGHEVVAVTDGAAAWDVLQREDSPPLAILDWMMPGLDGIELCQRVRDLPGHKARYLILLTCQAAKGQVIAGLRAGANDYVTKPFDPEELHARVNVGAQLVELQTELRERVQELEAALARVQRLQGLLPICAYCKSIRDDHDYWHQVDNYLREHSGTQFTHAVCPDCWDKVVKPECDKLGIKLPARLPQ
jgi:CheY-like chemotaxis protein